MCEFPYSRRLRQQRFPDSDNGNETYIKIPNRT
jgi:hypothetical protein